MTQNSGHSVVFQGLSRLTLPATAESWAGELPQAGSLLELQRQGSTANLPADGISATANSMAPIKMPGSMPASIKSGVVTSFSMDLKKIIFWKRNSRDRAHEQAEHGSP